MVTGENILLRGLDERWKKFRAELKTCKSEFSAEAVHDLRVATRRLLAVIDILRVLDPHPRVQKVRRVLKDQLDSLDELRDTQVMLVNVSESLVNFPNLQAFEKGLLTREKRLLRQARKEIRELPVTEMKRRVEKCRIRLDENAHHKDWTVRILSAVDQAYARAIQAFGQIEASQPATIHQFRVTFKKFRYMVEIANPLLQEYPEVYLKQMHEYQSRMGDVQDVEVFLGAFAEFEEQHDRQDDLVSVREWFEARRLKLITVFMEGRNMIRDFWRGSPDSKFTWEKSHESIHHSPRDRGGGRNAQLRRRQPAPADREGQEENAIDRAGFKGTGSGDSSDSDQPISASNGNSEDSAEGI